jgi:hypothetical protein
VSIESNLSRNCRSVSTKSHAHGSTPSGVGSQAQWLMLEKVHITGGGGGARTLRAHRTHNVSAWTLCYERGSRGGWFDFPPATCEWRAWKSADGRVAFAPNCGRRIDQVSGECDYATAASAAGDCDEAARSARRPSSVSLDVGGLSQRERVRRRSVTAPPPLSSLSADRSIHPQPHTNHPALPPCVASDTPLEHVHAPQRRRQRASIQHKGSLIQINI